jgi:hypothetical protein
MTLLRNQLQAAGVLTALALTACSGSGTSPSSVTTVNVSKNVLQLAVGTANIYGDVPANAMTGINVVTTYRQPVGGQAPGRSGTLVNSPTFSGPFVLPATAGTADGYDSTIETGPAPNEVSTSTMSYTPQTGTTVSTFGISGGAFGIGLEPFNYQSGGQPAEVAPYTVPLYDPVSGDTNAFVPWGGPPAFDPNGDGLGVRDGGVYPSGTFGISMGIDPFAGITPVTGTYTLLVKVPGQGSGFAGSSTATANLTSTALLPAIPAPATVTADGLGGLSSIPITLPAGVTEAYIQITDLGPDSGADKQPASCNGSAVDNPTYYTIYVNASGSATLGDSSGPGTPSAPTPSLCTSAQNTTANSATTDGDDFTISIIAFDYPQYEASYTNAASTKVVAPTLAGPNGQADISISSAGGYSQPAASASKVLRKAPSHVRVVPKASMVRHIK